MITFSTPKHIHLGYLSHDHFDNRSIRQPCTLPLMKRMIIGNFYISSVPVHNLLYTHSHLDKIPTAIDFNDRMFRSSKSISQLPTSRPKNNIIVHTFITLTPESECSSSNAHHCRSLPLKNPACQRFWPLDSVFPNFLRSFPSCPGSAPSPFTPSTTLRSELGSRLFRM